MLARSIASLAAVVLAALGAGSAPAFAQAEQRVSGPHVHRNLAIFLIRGRSTADPVPLTLSEALAKGAVQVTETGMVNELKVENVGNEEVFIQAGDMVKGGRQDRVLVVSLLLPPRSGAVPIASFCVEPGRWSARAHEDPSRFASASEAMPSRQTLLVMAAPPAPSAARTEPTPGAAAQRPANDLAVRQRQVWDSVARTQAALTSGLGVGVAAPQSATSLQLSLEHTALKEAQEAYVAALEAPGLADGDVVGYVAAINGRPVSADVYPSNGLFRKMWHKQLAAVVTEAIGSKADAAAASAPPVADVQAFLAAAEQGSVLHRDTAADMRQETRVGEHALYNEARSAGNRWIHRSYLAK